MLVFLFFLLSTLAFGQNSPPLEKLWKAKVTALQGENEELKSKINFLTSGDTSKSLADFDKLHQNNVELKAQHNKLLETNKKSKDQRQDLFNEYKKLETENQELKDGTERLNTENGVLIAKNKQFKAQNEELNDKIGVLKTDLEQFKKCSVHFEVQTAAVFDADTTAKIYMQLHGTSYSFPVIALHDIEHEKSGGYNHGTLDSFNIDFLCSLLQLNKITHLDVFIAGSDDAWLPAHVTVSSNDGAVYRFNNRDNLWLEVGEGYSTMITLKAE